MLSPDSCGIFDAEYEEITRMRGEALSDARKGFIRSAVADAHALATRVRGGREPQCVLWMHAVKAHARRNARRLLRRAGRVGAARLPLERLDQDDVVVIVRAG